MLCSVLAHMFKCTSGAGVTVLDLHSVGSRFDSYQVGGWSRDSLVCAVTGYGLDGRGSIPGRGKDFFLHDIQTDP
jgi:hypothetical protein